MTASRQIEALTLYKYQLTVIVPVSNMGGKLNFIETWLPNVRNQGIQVIIVHDERDEKTGLELELLVSKHNIPGISLITGQFGSPGSARNAGLNLAEGRWIAFWDSDDVPLVGKFIQMIEAAESNGSMICIGGFKVINEFTGDEVNRSIPPVNFDFLNSYLQRNGGIWRFGFRETAIKEIIFPPLSMAEDQVFLVRAKVTSRQILSYQEVVYEYSVGSGSHLTKNRNVMADLIPASRLTLQVRGDTRLEKFGREIAIRQLFSAIKYGLAATKVLASLEIINNFFTQKIGIKDIFKAIKRWGVQNEK